MRYLALMLIAFTFLFWEGGKMISYDDSLKNNNNIHS